MSKQKITVWALTLLLTLFFLVAGLSKLREAFHIVANYNAMGISIGVMKAIGTLEIVGAIALLFKKTSRYAVLGLVAVGIFTLISSAIFQIWDAAIAAVVVLLLTLALARFLNVRR